MKSILMIGMGRFGSHLCMNLSKLDNEIMIVDACEEKLRSEERRVGKECG